ELRKKYQLKPENINSIEITIFDVAFKIIGGGEEGNKHIVRTKEQADHSLPYMVAVALLDGEVSPNQYEPKRILKNDVRNLMKKILIKDDKALSEQFPEYMVSHTKITLQDGTVLNLQKKDYEGFHSHPMKWEEVISKFDKLASEHTTTALR